MTDKESRRLISILEAMEDGIYVIKDDYTVEFHLKYPANLPLIATAICSTYIMDSKMLSEIGNDTEITKYFNEGHDAGTGPYYLSSFDAKTEVVMKKFEDYWGGWTDDQFDIAIVKIVPDPSLREQMVMGNEIQITTFLPLDDIPILENNPNVDIVESPSFLEIYGMFNTLKEPLNNKLVRQALAYATPYEDIIEYVGPDLLHREYTLFAADGAVQALLEYNIVPHIITTDLDGNIEDLIKANKEGSVVIIHAHGDNIDKIKSWLPKFEGKIMVTTQTEPFDDIYDFGGFTDGDRAYCIAKHFHACRIFLLGFDFENVVEKEGKDSKIKARKLKWAERIIKWHDML